MIGGGEIDRRRWTSSKVLSRLVTCVFASRDTELFWKWKLMVTMLNILIVIQPAMITMQRSVLPVPGTRNSQLPKTANIDSSSLRWCRLWELFCKRPICCAILHTCWSRWWRAGWRLTGDNQTADSMRTFCRSRIHPSKEVWGWHLNGEDQCPLDQPEFLSMSCIWEVGFKTMWSHAGDVHQGWYPDQGRGGYLSDF